MCARIAFPACVVLAGGFYYEQDICSREATKAKEAAADLHDTQLGIDSREEYKLRSTADQYEAQANVWRRWAVVGLFSTMIAGIVAVANSEGED